MTYISINQKNSYLNGFDSNHDHAITDADIKTWAKINREYPEDLYETRPKLVENLFWMDTASAKLRREYIEIFADDNCGNPFWKNIGPEVSPKESVLIARKMEERFSQRDKFFNEAREQVSQLADAAAGYPLSALSDDFRRSIMAFFFPEIKKAIENEGRQLFLLRNNVIDTAGYGYDGPAGIGIGIATTDDTKRIKVLTGDLDMKNLEELKEEKPETADLIKHNFDERVIYRVYSNTPAGRAGLQKGDIITAINGKRTDKMQMPGSEIYFELIGPCGGTVSLDILRGGQALHFDVKRGIDVLYNFAENNIDRYLPSSYPEMLGE